MKKGKAAAIGFFLLMICCLFPAGETQAATAKRLFSLVVNDGFVEQTISCVPLYIREQLICSGEKESAHILRVCRIKKCISKDHREDGVVQKTV